MTPARQAWVYWIPAASWAAIIFALSAQPSLPSPPGGLTDKHAHAITYGILAGCCLFALTRGSLAAVTVWRVVAAALLATVYGLSDEVHQAFVPGREADAFDLVADAAGASLAAGAAWACAILLRGRVPRA